MNDAKYIGMDVHQATIRSDHFCSFQSPEMFFLLTLPFIERCNRWFCLSRRMRFSRNRRHVRPSFVPAVPPSSADGLRKTLWTLCSPHAKRVGAPGSMQPNGEF
jgi:hypothetical protein